MSRIETLSLCALLLLGAAGCASTGQSKVAQTPNLTPEQIQDAERAGYHAVVAKSGETLFCRKALIKTGSHVAKDECHTAEEWNRLNVRGNQQAHDEIDKASMKQLPAVVN